MDQMVPNGCTKGEGETATVTLTPTRTLVSLPISLSPSKSDREGVVRVTLIPSWARCYRSSDGMLAFLLQERGKGSRSTRTGPECVGSTSGLVDGARPCLEGDFPDGFLTPLFVTISDVWDMGALPVRKEEVIETKDKTKRKRMTVSNLLHKRRQIGYLLPTERWLKAWSGELGDRE